MARDRLAAMRAQQGQQGENPFGSDASTPTTRQTRQPNPYDRRDQGYDQQGSRSDYSNQYASNPSQQPRYGQGDSYELAPVNNGGQYGRQYSDASASDMDRFQNEIAAIQEKITAFDRKVTVISQLHKTLLDDVGPGNGRANQQLENEVDEMRTMSSNLKNQIKALQSQRVDAKAASMRKPQIDLVRTKFMEAITKYQAMEKLYRDKYKERLTRQFKIVNPNATDDEVAEALSSDQSVQIFAQATMGNRIGESRNAYGAVRDRLEELKRVEESIVELAQLFNDMSLLVEQQDDTINIIETNAEGAKTDIEAGKGYTDKAVVSARAYRKKRWICFFLTLIILIIVGVAVGVEVSKNVNTNNNKNSGSST
ncbi:hypothetical protein M0805_006064 [Coniferiporia weirii]|nr:hypothetical protein M0805_006064 [Coniferiporia weirii]